MMFTAKSFHPVQDRVIIGRNITKLLKHTSSIDYQYLQRSKIPTMHFQKSLPRLPIPKLTSTCERYLAAQKPLLIDESFRKTESNVNRFSSTTGQQVQKYLEEYDKANKHTSYISEMWFDMYLRDRKPLPINYNPILVLHNEENEKMNDQLIRATNLIISSLRFYNSLRTDCLEPEVFHLNPKKSDTAFFRNLCSKTPEFMSWYSAYMFNAYPLDMSQYRSLFNSTRIPETDKDRLFNAHQQSAHITVQHKGHFYVVKVLSPSNEILPAETILSRLNFILTDDIGDNEYPIGCLTTLNRNKWATLRHELLDLGNETKLKLIDSALFHVCLDTEEIADNRVDIVRHFLHSDSRNRWFDKSFSLIVSKNGYSGVNFEHAWGDGVAVLRYIQDIYKDSSTKPLVSVDSKMVDDKSEIFRLDMTLNDNLKGAIKTAFDDYQKLCSTLDINFLLFEGIGKKMCKTAEVSPDSVMQLAFQVAYHKMTGKFVPTYESCSTAAFKHGRTETIRPLTVATKKMTVALNNQMTKSSVQELKQMLNECSKTHGQLTKEAAMGQGFDRHLFALKHFAEKNNIVCNIFHDPEYIMLNHNILSTSTLSSPAILAGGFGPVVQDGLGIGYMIQDEACGAVVSNYLGSVDGKGFIDALKASFEDILKVLQCKK